MVSNAPKEMFRDNSKNLPSPNENKGPHVKKGPLLMTPIRRKKDHQMKKKAPHNVNKNPKGIKNAYFCPPPPARPCMALLQYYNNAREISSSLPTPHPHNEIVNILK